MKRKQLLLLAAVALAAFAVFTFLRMDFKSQADTVPTGALRWIREKSSCTDISIQNDRVVLAYSLHFENTTVDDYWVCYPQASFRRIELLGWMEYDNFSGYGKTGESTFLVPANDAVDIVVSFEGNYLGGPVNDNISLPSIVFVQKRNKVDYS